MVLYGWIWFTIKKTHRPKILLNIPRLVRELLRSTDIKAEDLVIEIGPGQRNNYPGIIKLRGRNNRRRKR